jgi:uncharacterized protein
MIKIKAKITSGAPIDEVQYDEKAEMLNISIQHESTSGIANNYIVEFLAKEIEIPKSKIEIIKGLESHYKTIGIANSWVYFKSKISTEIKEL